MFRTLLACMTFIALAFSTPALAYDGKIKEFNFEDDLVEGEIASAGFTDIKALGEGELISLIQIRSDFIDKMLSDMDDLP